MNITKKFFVISFFAVLMAFIIFSSFNKNVQAASTDNVTGYAWSSNIGWISLNCTNTNSCGTSNYGLTIANNGDLTGFAWNSNIGWIKFGGFANSSIPNTSGDGTQPHNANLSGSNITGWARACSGLNDVVTNPQTDQTASNNTCTGATRADGWDGWISLTGNNYGITVNSSTGAMTGFAWGSDVVGWIQFNGSTTQTPSSLTFKVSVNGAAATTGPVTVNVGDTVSFSSIGSLLNTTAGAGTANFTVDPNGATNWNGVKTCPSSLTTPTVYTPSFQLTNSTASTVAYTYSLSCPNASGFGSALSNIITINVNPPSNPSLTLIATTADGSTSVPSGTITVASGTAFTLSALGNSLNITAGAGTAAGSPSFSGAKTCPASLTTPTVYSTITYTNPTSSPVTHTFTLSCPYASGGGPVVGSVNIVVSPAVTPVSLLLKVTGNGVTGTSITVNSGDIITLSATGASLNTTANAGTASLDWSGNVTCPSSTSFPTSYPSRVVTNGSVNFSNTYSYKLTCPKASDGTAYASNTVQVIVNPAAMPSVTLKAYSDPSFVNQIVAPLPPAGANVYLQWSSINANSCVSSNLNLPTPLNISGWSGLSQPSTGSTGAIFTNNDTTFQLTCYFSGVGYIGSAPVQVGPAGPVPLCPSLGTPPCPKKQPVFIEI